MKTIAWGIIGCGNVCEKKSGPAFYKTSGSKLVAVMRRDARKAAEFADRHQIDHYYTDAEELINDPAINAIYVATPPDTHKTYAIRSLKAGKPVYVEKPMALDYASCLEMIEAAKESGQRLFVAYYRRGQPYFNQIKQLLDSGSIGKPLTAEIRHFKQKRPHDTDPKNWRLIKEMGGNGYFYDLAPHTLDILDYLLGEVAEASGFHNNLSHIYEVADTVGCTLKFKTGVIASGIWNFTTSAVSEEDTVIIRGEKGEIQFNTFSYQPIRLLTDSETKVFDIPPPEHVQQPLIESIVHDLAYGTNSCPSTGVSAARTSWVIEQIMSH